MMSETTASYLTRPVNPSSFNQAVKCERVDTTWAIGLAFVPVALVIFNAFVTVATYHSRKKLRHNYVYAYVISMMTGNVIFGILSLYNIVNYAFTIERMWGSPLEFNVDPTNPYHRSLQLWWTIRRSFSIGMFLVINGNVSALIYGIRDSAYFVGRTTSPNALDNRQEASIRRRRNKAACIIGFIWAVPICLSCAGVGTSLNCLDHCICVYADYGDSIHYCQTDKFHDCSRIWQPLKKGFLLGVAVLWCVEVLAIIAMLVTTVRKSIYVMKPKNAPLSNEEVKNNNSELKTTEKSTNDTLDRQMDNDQVSQHPHSNSNLSAVTVNVEDVRANQGGSCFGSINRTVKFLLTVSLLFIVTTLPSVIVILVDSASEQYIIPRHIVSIVATINMLYGVFVPIVLISFMSRLRSAVQGLFLSIKCCTITTVHVHKSSKSQHK